MTDAPQQPATKAGRALLADILAAHFGPEDLLADRILAIEAEAAAGLLDPFTSEVAAQHAEALTLLRERDEAREAAERADAGLLALQSAMFRLMAVAHIATTLHGEPCACVVHEDARRALERTAPAATEEAG